MPLATSYSVQVVLKLLLGRQAKFALTYHDLGVNDLYVFFSKRFSLFHGRQNDFVDVINLFWRLLAADYKRVL